MSDPQRPESPVPPIDPPRPTDPQFPYGAAPTNQYPSGAAPTNQYPYGAASAPLSPQTFTPSGTQPPKRSGLGLASLIVGGVAFLLAFVPFVNYVSGVVALVGIVLGIVALVQKYRRKGLAIAGLIVSVVAGILSIVLAIAYTAALIDATENAVDDASSFDVPVAPEEEPTAGPAAGDIGSRENPAPIGTTIELSDGYVPEWEITPGTPTLDANALIVAENEFNETAPAGSQFALLPVTVKYVGETTGIAAGIDVEFVTEAGTTHGVYDTPVLVADDLFLTNELYPNAEATGNVAIAVPTEGIENGTWRISSLLGEEYFFAAQ